MKSMEPASPQQNLVHARLVRRIRENSGTLSLPEAIHTCLYEPGIGYYRKDRKRVGRSSGTDFYTASSLGPVFAQLILACVESLLPEPPDNYIFVELGPESGAGIIAHLENPPFRDCRTVRPGEPLRIPEKCVCFSNEVLDAQPFRRFRFEKHAWEEAFVTSTDGNSLELVYRKPLAPPPQLPRNPGEGYLIDWPEGAHTLLHDLSRQPWEGLFLTLDYGLPRQTLFTERPSGTARTYHRHGMGSDLLADPGNEDITCHLVWEELEQILLRHGFHDLSLQRQESFFMHHGHAAVKSIMESTGPGFAPRKQTLMELLHPGNMGHRFQALHALR